MKKLAFIFALCLFSSSCGEESSTPPTTQDLSLKKSSFSELLGWQQDDVNEAVKAFKKSCQKIKDNKNEYIDNLSAIQISTKDYQ